MDTETIITWNVTNWLTVVLMVALFFVAFVLLTQGVRKIANARKGSADAAA